MRLYSLSLIEIEIKTYESFEKVYQPAYTIEHLFSVTYAQDIHFSNFYNAPLILNPANTGNYIGNWRIISNYRVQGDLNTVSFKTSTLAFDIPVYYYKQMGSIGAIFINDLSADNTLFVNKGYLSIAHFLKISTKSYLHLGFQFGFVHKNFSLNHLSLPDQFDMTTGYFNPGMPTQEIDMERKTSYFDANWGLIWSRKSGKINSEIGISMFHYNTPTENFSQIEFTLPARYSMHGYFELNINKKFYLKPKLLYTTQNKAHEILLGQDAGIRFNDSGSNNDFNIGIYYRGGFGKNIDVFISKVGFTYKSINFGFAYDFEIPNQSISGYSKSAFEISVQYTRPSTNLKNKTIPCEIF